ncbi:cupin domain-containing protein [Tolypothrix sp. VBCCA 56010]|uniref:cupin domain-containing protein n=1 Tax=Tolypothrix sp. VBCCA 56010 TaxID=3137731 RepID=UPI003D7CF217
MTVNSKPTYFALGDFYTFLATGEDTDGKYSLTEMMLQPQSVAPAHIHDSYEAHYVLEGEVEYQVDDKTIVATPGTFLQFPIGQAHGFKNVTSQPAKILAFLTPPGGEQFFAEVGQKVNLPMSEEEKQKLLVPPIAADFEKAVELAVTKYRVQFAPQL